MIFLALIAGVLLNGLAFYLLRVALEPFWPGLLACFTTLIPKLGAECLFEPDLFRGTTGVQVAVAFLALLLSYLLGRFDADSRSSLRPLLQLNQAVSGVVILLALVWLVVAILNAVFGTRFTPQ